MSQMEGERALGFPVSSGDCVAGKYEILRVLGRGAMGVVFEAKHLTLAQPVAIKFLLPEHSVMPTAASRFLTEARAAGRIRSEHVARILDTDRLPNGLPYIVMEYLSGCSLAERLEQHGRFPREEAVDILLQAAIGVAEAHAVGIVHRDLKPANLFVTTGSDHQPLVKVLDFGISKICDNQADGAMTCSDCLLGSPHYMSPEQMRSPDKVDERSDIWSLGIILFELLTGRVPFPGKTVLSIFAEGLSVPSLSSQCPDIPPALAAVVTRCLSRQRAERFSSVAELASALRPFGTKRASRWVDRIQGIACSPNSPIAIRPSARETMAVAGLPRSVSLSRRSRWLLAIGLPVLVAFILVVLGGYAQLNQREGTAASKPVESHASRVAPSPVVPMEARPSVKANATAKVPLASGTESSMVEPSRNSTRILSSPPAQKNTANSAAAAKATQQPSLRVSSRQQTLAELDRGRRAPSSESESQAKSDETPVQNSTKESSNTGNSPIYDRLKLDSRY